MYQERVTGNMYLGVCVWWGVPLVLLSQRKLVVFIMVEQVLTFIYLVFVFRDDSVQHTLQQSWYTLVEKKKIITMHLGFIVRWERCLFTFVFASTVGGK